jgi:hypothetical protein
MALPYMSQLPRDWYKNQLSGTAVPVAITSPPPSSETVVVPVYITQPEPPAGLGGEGAAWVGAAPPDTPFYGMLWYNTNNNGLYVYTDVGVLIGGVPGYGTWEQVGTNW